MSIPQPTDLRERHRLGLPIVNGWLSMPSGFGAELAARAGYDSLTIDMQHGMVDFCDVLPMLQGTSIVGTPTLVRVPSAFDHVCVEVMMKVLDAGAHGVIAPQMDSPAIARQIVDACRYPPLGQRSSGATRASFALGSTQTPYAKSANTSVLAFGMIESQAALDDLDAILDTPGLDGIYIGPNDLSLSLGEPAASEPTSQRVVDAIERIRLSAQSRGLIAGIFCSNGEACAMRLKQGFNMVTPAHDVAALMQGHSQRLNAARSVSAPISSSKGY